MATDCRCHQIATQALKAQGKEMKEEREAFIRENEERMARRKAYIRSLEKDIGQCEVKESERWGQARYKARGYSCRVCFSLIVVRAQKSIHDMKTKTQAHLSVIQSLISPLQVSK